MCSFCRFKPFFLKWLFLTLLIWQGIFACASGILMCPTMWECLWMIYLLWLFEKSNIDSGSVDLWCFAGIVCSPYGSVFLLDCWCCVVRMKLCHTNEVFVICIFDEFSQCFVLSLSIVSNRILPICEILKVNVFECSEISDSFQLAFGRICWGTVEAWDSRFPHPGSQCFLCPNQQDSWQ